MFFYKIFASVLSVSRGVGLDEKCGYDCGQKPKSLKAMNHQITGSEPSLHNGITQWALKNRIACVLGTLLQLGCDLSMGLA